MGDRFTVLGSGSTGNAALLESHGNGLLIDCGLSPRQISSRLGLIDRSWRDIRAVILTHIHSDHWNRAALQALLTHRVTFCCHAKHMAALAECEQFAALRSAGLVRFYRANHWFDVLPAVRVRPIELSHDAEPTFAFRFEGQGSLFSSEWAIGYAADLGQAEEHVISGLANVNLLAVEFNHDVRMQKSSGRPSFLIERVLGPFGHLSNRQGAELVSELLARSETPPSLGVIALHRSLQCNTPDLVAAAARPVLKNTGMPLQLAEASTPTSPIELTLLPHATSRRASEKPSRGRQSVAR